MSIDVAVQDNFLKLKDYHEIYNYFMSANPMWGFNTSVKYGGSGEQNSNLDDFQFVNVLYHNGTINSDGFNILSPILDKIKPRALLRIKANLVPRLHKIVEHEMHIDYHWDDSITSVFYVNTNNGYTKFKDGTKVDSVGNRLVTFPSTIEHCGTTCTDTKSRVVLNFNYF